MSIVNQQQKEEFLELGFIKIDNVISEKELNWLRDRYETLFETIKQKSLGGTDEGGKSLLPQVLGISRKFPEFSDLEYRKNIAVYLGSTAESCSWRRVRRREPAQC